MKELRKENGAPPKKRTHFEKTATIEIGELGLHGEGIFREKDSIVYVPGAIPGDKVTVTIRRKRNGIGEATIRNIISPSQGRVNPGCVAYEQGCGGCQLLHFEYGKQCEWKTSVLRETMRRVWVSPELVRPIARMEDPEHARNKLSLACDERGTLGMCPEQSSDIMLINECKQEMQVNMIVHAALKKMKLHKSISQVQLRAQQNNTVGMFLFAKEFTKPIAEICRTIMSRIPQVAGVGVRTYRGYQHVGGSEHTEHRIGGITYRIPIQGFFQTNYFQAENLLRFVIGFAMPDKNESICDLYSGCGFFTLPLAKLAKNITGIESSKLSHDAAIQNAHGNRISNIRFLNANVVSGLHGFKKDAFDTVVLDPPRMGCDPKVLDELLRILPKKIVYVSCAPDVLQHDIAIMIRNGYKVSKCQPLDMFPHTYHIETVVLLTRAARS
jgi:23S rRNA (uracil1939-C5)-methyltransferase